MRTILTTGFALLLTVATALGQTDKGTDTGGIARARIPDTLKFLNERISQVAFQDAPLDQVMEWLGKQTPMQVQVRWQVLIDAGIERDKPITMNVHDLRLSQILWMIMKEAGGTDLPLAYRASDRILTISTAEDLGKEMVVRVYDVSDLLVRAQSFRSAPTMDLSQAGQSMGQGGGGGSNIFSGGQSGGQDENNEDRNTGQAGQENPDMKELTDLITATVEPDSWEANGGRGTIKAFRNLLVVRNNILVHQALGGYVEEEEAIKR
jgi:hypothetical protein